MRLSSKSRIKGLVLVAICWTAWPSLAQGADADGQFAIKGIGIFDCQRFVEARAANDQVYMRFRSWLAGYLTAVNLYEPDTYDSVPWETTEILTIIIDNHCQQNPEERFVQAAQRLVLTLKDDRLSTQSPLLRVTAGGLSTRLYEEVLRRLQNQLAELGIYSDTPDGIFGPKTEQAIATFQVSEGLDGTGLPDPLTVWKLMKP